MKIFAFITEPAVILPRPLQHFNTPARQAGILPIAKPLTDTTSILYASDAWGVVDSRLSASLLVGSEAGWRFDSVPAAFSSDGDPATV